MNNQCQIQLCRLCLLEKNAYAAIYEANEIYGFHIANVINELLELDVSPSDGLPEKVCHDCLEEVARFKRFKNVCHEAKYTYKNLNIHNNVVLTRMKVEAKDEALSDALTNDIHIEVDPKDDVLPEACKNNINIKVEPKDDVLPAAFGNNIHVKIEPKDDVLHEDFEKNINIKVEPKDDVLPAAFGNNINIKAEPKDDVLPEAFEYNANIKVEAKDDDHFVAVENEIHSGFMKSESLDISEEESQCKVKSVYSITHAEYEQHGSKYLPNDQPLFDTPQKLNKFHDVCELKHQTWQQHQFSSYIPPGTRMEHSIFDKPKEPEVVDLVDDDDDDEDNNGVRRNAYPLAQTLASPCHESGNSRPGSDTSVIIKTEGNEDSDLENMCEHPLPVETVLSEPDGDLSSVSVFVKSENSHNAVEGRDDSLGLFSLTSTFSDLMASTDGVGNSCMPRNPIIHGEQLPQNNSSDGVARPLENPNKYPFWCPICGKNFMRKDKLKQHSVVHSNERPFICRICGCSYKRKDKLTSHVTSSHLQHLPFQCDICGKRFVRKDKLKQHGVVHSNRRPYACKECGKRYKSKTEQKKHEKRAHSQDPPL